MKILGFNRFISKKSGKEMIILFLSEPIISNDNNQKFGFSTSNVIVFPNVVENIDLISAVKAGSELDIRFNRNGFVVSVDLIKK